MSSSPPRFLHFEVSGHACALPIANVREVLPMATLTRAPQLPSFIEGFLNIGGVALPVVRLDRVLGLPAGNAGSASHLVWIRDESVQILFLVDRVHAVFTTSVDETLTLPSQQTFNGCVVAQVKLANVQLHVLSLDKLLLAQERKTLAEFSLLTQKRLLGDGKASA